MNGNKLDELINNIRTEVSKHIKNAYVGVCFNAESECGNDVECIINIVESSNLATIKFTTDLDEAVSVNFNWNFSYFYNEKKYVDSYSWLEKLGDAIAISATSNSSDLNM